MILTDYMERHHVDRDFYRKMISLTMPIAFQQFMLAAVAAADSIMLGRLEQNAMAAVSLATQIQFVLSLFTFAFAEAAMILGAQYWGKGNKKAIGDIFCTMLKTSVLVSAVFSGACELIPERLMWLFTSEPELIAIGASYLRIAGWSYLLTGISQCYLTIMKISDHATASSAISSIAVVVNIILNAIFIFGLLGMESLGSDGAALATLISRIIEVFLCLSVSCKGTYIRPALKGFIHGSRILSADFYHHLVPLLGAAILWGVGFTSYTSAMGHMGTDAAAANAVAAVVRDLMCCLCTGVAVAGGIIVGNELGKGELEKGKTYGIKAAVMSVIIGIGCCLVIIAVIPFVINFMVLTDTARKYLSGIMVIMAVYMIGRCMNTVIINGVFACGGDTKFDVYSLIVCMWCISIPLAFLGVFAFNWSPYLVYVFTGFDEIIKIPWVIIHFRKYKWVRDLTRQIPGDETFEASDSAE